MILDVVRVPGSERGDSVVRSQAVRDYFEASAPTFRFRALTYGVGRRHLVHTMIRNPRNYIIQRLITWGDFWPDMEIPSKDRSRSLFLVPHTHTGDDLGFGFGDFHYMERGLERFAYLFASNDKV